MYDHLQIGSDPTVWTLTESIDAAALSQPGHPLAATVTDPLPGTLLVSGRAASTVLSGGEGGPVPTDAAPVPRPSPSPGPPPAPSGPGSQTAFLYLPTEAGLDSSSPGYPLPAGSNLGVLRSNITAALTQGTFLTVEVSLPTQTGALLLNGAALPFIALLSRQE